MNTDVVDAVKSDGAQPLPAPAPRGDLSVVQYAVQQGASVDEIRAILELQVRADKHQIELMRERRRMDEEDRARAAVLAYRADFAAFRGENIVVPKSKRVDRGNAGSFDQAEFHLVAAMLSPSLSKHGFSFRHDQRFGARAIEGTDPPAHLGWVWVKCYLEHKDGHVETLELEGPEGDLKANTPVQNMQATASYLKRQSLLAITGTATGGEDDENKMRSRQHDVERPEPTAAQIQQAEEQVALGAAKFAEWWNALPSETRKLYGRERREAWLAEAKKVAT